MTDLPPIIPVSVECVFPALYPLAVHAPYSVTVTLASLSLPEFSGVATNPNATMVLESTQQAIYDNTNTLTNGAALGTLATQMATDWYRWQLGKVDLVYKGVCSWTPEGLSDGIEIIFAGKHVTTRIQRGTWHIFNDGGQEPTTPAGNLIVSDGVNTFTGISELILLNGTLTNGGGVATYTPGNQVGDISTYRISNGIFTPLEVGGPDNSSGFGMPSAGAHDQIFGIPFALPFKRTLAGLAVFLRASSGSTDTAAGTVVQLALYTAASASDDTITNFVSKTVDISVYHGATLGWLVGSLVGGHVDLNAGDYWILINAKYDGDASVTLGGFNANTVIAMLKASDRADGAGGGRFWWRGQVNQGDTTYGTWPNPMSGPAFTDRVSAVCPRIGFILT